MGIYIHIPFCRKACTYCDFHFSTNVGYTQRLVDAIRKEIRQRKDAHPKEVGTIYFGGGTPSVLTKEQIKLLIDEIRAVFQVSIDAEITLEANPDDLKLKYLEDLKAVGINRLSIGVQSFNNDVLKWMNRSHNTGQSIEAIANAHSLGFENITADLIFGIPEKDGGYWAEQLERAINLGINHLSVYSLTIEEHTVLDHRIRKGLQKPPLVESQAEQFTMTMSKLTENDYEHYEISNYARSGFRSRHNSSYWNGQAYLGLGPSAHSFDGKSQRSWNIANNHLYMKGIENNEAVREIENLSHKDRVNEFILTRIRTSEGLSLNECSKETGHTLDHEEYQKWVDGGKLTVQNNILLLTNEGKLISDAIASSLFIL